MVVGGETRGELFDIVSLRGAKRGEEGEGAGRSGVLAF